MKLTDLATQQDRIAGFVGLLLGEQGSGKSSAAASFAEDGPHLVIDIDKRARGILGCEQFLGPYFNNIEIEQYDFNDGFSKIDEKLEILLAYVKQRAFKYKTIQLDSVATLLDMLMLDSQKLRGALDKKFTPGEGKFQGKVRGKVAFPHPDDYNYVKIAFQQIFYDGVMRLPCNFIFTGWTTPAYEKDPNNEYAPAKYIGQKMLGDGQIAQRVPGLFDEVYEFTKEETGVSTSPTRYKVKFESKLAKTAIPELRGTEADITGKSFYQFLKSKITKQPLVGAAK